MNNKHPRTSSWGRGGCLGPAILFGVSLVALTSVTLAQVVHDYNPPALGASEAVQRNDLNIEYDGINTDKLDPVDIDTSVEILGIVGDAIGSGALMFGLDATMADDLGCTSLQVVQRNAADNAFECASPAGAGDALVANPLSQFAATTSAQLRGVMSDELGTGALLFGLHVNMEDGLACSASQFVKRNAADNAFECGSGAAGLVSTDIDTSAELRTIMTDEIDTGALVFLGTPADDQVPIGASAVDTVWTTIPDSDAAGTILGYDAATNAFNTKADDDVPDAGDYGNLSAVLPITQSGGSITTSMTTDRLIGRTTAATGAMEEIVVGATLDLSALNLDVATSGIAIGNMADDSVGIDELDLVAADTPVDGDCLTYDAGVGGGSIEAITCPGGAGGDSVTVNSVAVVDPDFDDALPAAPAGGKNVTWQTASNDISGHITAASTTAIGVAEVATTTEQLTGTSAALASSPDSVAAVWEKGSDVASSGTISLGEGGLFHITGTTTITDIDWATAKDGRCAKLIFDGVLTLTHHATTLILPGAQNIITGAGDKAIVCQDSSDNVVMLDFTRQAASLEFLNPTENFCVAFSDDIGTAITTGVAKITFRMPYAFTLTGIRASLTGASSSGAPIFDVNEAGTTIMTTNKLLIDVSELTSVTAGTAATLTDTSLADDASMTVDVDTAGTGADGGKMCLIGRRT